MKADLAIIINIIGFMITLSSFYISMQKEAKKSASDFAEIKLILEYLESNFFEMKTDIKNQNMTNNQLKTDLELVKKDITIVCTKIEDIKMLKLKA